MSTKNIVTSNGSAPTSRRNLGRNTLASWAMTKVGSRARRRPTDWFRGDDPAMRLQHRAGILAAVVSEAENCDERAAQHDGTLHRMQSLQYSLEK